MSRKRKNFISFRLDDKELLKIKDNISKTQLSRSDFIRKCILGKEFTVIPGIKDLLFDLREVSSYLGHVTWMINKGDITVLGDELKEIKEGLGDVWTELSKVLKKI